MICGSHKDSVASRASDMLIYNRPYIILVATGDRAYVNLHPWKITSFRGKLFFSSAIKIVSFILSPRKCWFFWLINSKSVKLHFFINFLQIVVSGRNKNRQVPEGILNPFGNKLNEKYMQQSNMGLHAVTQCGARKYPQLRENSPRNIGDWNTLCFLFPIDPEVYFY